MASGTDSVAEASFCFFLFVLGSNNDFGANGQHIAIIVSVRGCCVAIVYLEQSLTREQASTGLKSYESSNKQKKAMLPDWGIWGLVCALIELKVFLLSVWLLNEF